MSDNMDQRRIDALEDRYLDTLIELSFCRQEIEEAKARNEVCISNQTDSDHTEDDIERRYQAIRPGLMKRIADADRQKRNGGVLRFAQIAAALVCIISLSAVTAFAAIPEFRKQIARLIITFADDGQAELRLLTTADHIEKNVPEQWQGSYYPGWLPESFNAEVEYSDLKTTGHYLYMLSETGDYIDFGEYGDKSKSSINTEGMEITYTLINGSEAMELRREDYVSFVWSNDERYFELSGSIDRETLFKVAESIVKLK